MPLWTIWEFSFHGDLFIWCAVNLQEVDSQRAACLNEVSYEKLGLSVSFPSVYHSIFTESFGKFPVGHSNRVLNFAHNFRGLMEEMKSVEMSFVCYFNNLTSRLHGRIHWLSHDWLPAHLRHPLLFCLRPPTPPSCFLTHHSSCPNPTPNHLNQETPPRPQFSFLRDWLCHNMSLSVVTQRADVLMMFTVAFYCV